MALDKGTFLLSIDTEMAWGSVHDNSFERRRHMFEETRNAFSGLLELMERFEIHATWAVVGHLFLDQCKPVDGVKHPEIVRPSYPWFDGDWFKDDPCTDSKRSPFWYGPDMIDRILNCRVPQEIGSHGFSHTIIGDPNYSRESFDSELKACHEAARPWGVTLESFVFPRNSIGHLDVLRDNGFTSFRGRAAQWHRNKWGPVRKAGRFLESVLPYPPVTAMPRHAEGMWDFPETNFYLHKDGWARHVPLGVRILQARTALARAVDEQSIYHLWFHPFNLATDTKELLRGLESVFEHVARMRERGILDNPTMGELTRKMNTLMHKKELTA